MIVLDQFRGHNHVTSVYFGCQTSCQAREDNQLAAEAIAEQRCRKARVDFANSGIRQQDTVSNKMTLDDPESGDRVIALMAYPIQISPQLLIEPEHETDWRILPEHHAHATIGFGGGMAQQGQSSYVGQDRFLRHLSTMLLSKHDSCTWQILLQTCRERRFDARTWH
jgi:hypothetical protein